MTLAEVTSVPATTEAGTIVVFGREIARNQIRWSETPMTKKVLYIAGELAGVLVNRVPNMLLRPQILVKGFAANVKLAGDPCFLLTRCNPLAKFGSLLWGSNVN
jgi:hypothetical protein